MILGWRCLVASVFSLRARATVACGFQGARPMPGMTAGEESQPARKKGTFYTDTPGPALCAPEIKHRAGTSFPHLETRQQFLRWVSRTGSRESMASGPAWSGNCDPSPNRHNPLERGALNVGWRNCTSGGSRRSSRLSHGQLAFSNAHRAALFRREGCPVSIFWWQPRGAFSERDGHVDHGVHDVFAGEKHGVVRPSCAGAPIGAQW